MEALALVAPVQAAFESDVAGPLDEVTRAARGDVRAFEALYRTHLPRVHSLVRRMRAGRDADELTQDVFVRVWQKLGTFRGDSSFTTWLHRLAVNVVLMERRDRAHRAEESLDQDEEDEAVRAALARSPELKMDLEQAIAALPLKARQVLVLFDVEGYGHAEIAKLLGIAEGTSKAHLFRARGLLKEMLAR